jgi:hypothetical protein
MGELRVDQILRARTPQAAAHCIRAERWSQAAPPGKRARVVPSPMSITEGLISEPPRTAGGRASSRREQASGARRGNQADHAAGAAAGRVRPGRIASWAEWRRGRRGTWSVFLARDDKR